jgi:hypothetical protein
VRGVGDEGQPDREWLRTAEGRQWLKSDEGIEWERSEEGYAWMQSDDGRAWLDELAQGGFDDFFSGKMPEPPEGWIVPNAAPRIGARVRLVGSATTLGGTTLDDGELAVVSELHLMPIGAVRVVLRTIDGRTKFAFSLEDFVPATG